MYATTPPPKMQEGGRLVRPADAQACRNRDEVGRAGRQAGQVWAARQGGQRACGRLGRATGVAGGWPDTPNDVYIYIYIMYIICIYIIVYIYIYIERYMYIHIHIHICNCIYIYIYIYIHIIIAYYGILVAGQACRPDIARARADESNAHLRGAQETGTTRHPAHLCRRIAARDRRMLSERGHGWQGCLLGGPAKA